MQGKMRKRRRGNSVALLRFHSLFQEFFRYKIACDDLSGWRISKNHQFSDDKCSESISTTTEAPTTTTTSTTTSTSTTTTTSTTTSTSTEEATTEAPTTSGGLTTTTATTTSYTLSTTGYDEDTTTTPLTTTKYDYTTYSGSTTETTSTTASTTSGGIQNFYKLNTFSRFFRIDNHERPGNNREHNICRNWNVFYSTNTKPERPAIPRKKFRIQPADLFLPIPRLLIHLFASALLSDKKKQEIIHRFRLIVFYTIGILLAE